MSTEPAIQKSKRNRAATIERIIDAFEQVLVEKGIDGVNINTIALQAAVSKVLIYRYFGSIEGLTEYYLKMGRLIPQYSPTTLDQIQPIHPKEMASLWSAQTLQLFRGIRSSRAAREILKAAVKENNPLADAISRNQDDELTRFVDQLAFVKGGDYRAISAVLMGALSYLTIQAQLDRPVLDLDLRSDCGWQRIEEAIKVIFKSLNRSAMDSTTAHFAVKPVDLPVSTW